MILYRGISVGTQDEARVVQSFRDVGILGTEGAWQMRVPDLKSKIDSLWERVAIQLSDTKGAASEVPWICAAGDEQSAQYYAFKHNWLPEKPASILIAIEVNIANLIVDGRDFLYTVFQRGGTQDARSCLLEVYGPAIAKYIDRAWATEEQSQRIAICDIAVQDSDIIEAHYQNKAVLAGRYGTIFTSAFMVKVPIAPHQIVHVSTHPKSTWCSPQVSYRLSDIIK